MQINDRDSKGKPAALLLSVYAGRSCIGLC
jgi:hypothetical protein